MKRHEGTANDLAVSSLIRHPSYSGAFKVIRSLGTGGFAKVYEVQQTDDFGGPINRNESAEPALFFAVKVVNRGSLRSEKVMQRLRTEVEIHRQLTHDHIVRYDSSFSDQTRVYIFLELCSRGSLMDVAKARRRLSVMETQHVLLQTLEAVAYMHSKLVIHRDLKLGNIMLDNDFNVKVGDFGLATCLSNPKDRKFTICGTPNYIAPEVLDGKLSGHSAEADVWSLGVIMYTLLIGDPPFQTSDVKATYSRIRQAMYRFPETHPIPASARDLITRMLQPEPKRRPTLVDIRNHDFFRDPIPFGQAPRTLFQNPKTLVYQAPDYRAPVTGTPVCETTVAMMDAAAQRRPLSTLCAPNEVLQESAGAKAADADSYPLLSTAAAGRVPRSPSALHQPTTGPAPRRASVEKRRSSSRPSPWSAQPLPNGRTASPGVSHGRSHPTPLEGRGVGYASRAERVSQEVAPSFNSHPPAAASAGAGGAYSACYQDPREALTSRQHKRGPGGSQEPLLKAPLGAFETGARHSLPPTTARGSSTGYDGQERGTPAVLPTRPATTSVGGPAAVPRYGSPHSNRPPLLPTGFPVGQNVEGVGHPLAQNVDVDQASTRSSQNSEAYGMGNGAGRVVHTDPPIDLVSIYADYSFMYGLCYRMNNGTCGVFFNDSTKILNTNPIIYFHRERCTTNADKVTRPVDVALRYHANEIPPGHEDLPKKTRLMDYFGKFFAAWDKSVTSAKEPPVTCCSNHRDNIPRLNTPVQNVGPNDLPVYVKRWAVIQNAMIFRLSNRNLQICFEDKMELVILSGSNDFICTYPNGKRIITAMEGVNTFDREVWDRLRQAKSILSEAIAKRAI